MDVGDHEFKRHLSELLSRVITKDPLQRGVDEGWIRPPSRTGLIGEHERFPAPVQILDLLREDRDS